MPEMVELARRVAETRKQEEQLEKHWSSLYRDLRERYETLLKQIDEAKAERQQAETALKLEALAAFEAMGNKTPGPGVSIKVFTVLHYDE